MPGCKVNDLVVVIKRGVDCDLRGVTFTIGRQVKNPRRPEMLYWQPKTPVRHPVTGLKMRFRDSTLQPLRGATPKVVTTVTETAQA